MGKQTEDKGCFSKGFFFFNVNFSWCCLVSRDKVIILFLVWEVKGEEDTFGVDLCSGFRQIEGGRKASPVSAFAQSPSVQNNPYARVSYFRVAYSEPLHYTGIKMNMFV